MSTNDRFLGGVAPRTTPRTSAQTSSLRALVSKDERQTLSQADRIKLQNNAERGLESKYDLLDHVTLTDVQTLKAVYNMSIRTEELKEEMARYDMHEVMLIPNSMTYDASDGYYKPANGAQPVDLFTRASEIDLTLVCQFSEWMLNYGADYHGENLFWSGGKVLNSCTERLREKIEETASSFPMAYRTGPVYFVIMYQLILSSTPLSMRSVIRRLETMKLSDFEGENVKSAVSLLKGAVGLLDNNQSRPSDIVDIAFRILKTSSTAEFNTHVNAMRTNHDLGVKTVSLDELLHNVQLKYNELTINGEWELGTSTDQESAFAVSYECHSCGSADHFWRDCPTLDLDKVSSRLKALGIPASTPSGGRGRGRGRRNVRGGGRFSGSGRGNVFRIPPGANQPHIRRRGPLVERWCGSCQVWGSHATAQHKDAESAQVVALDAQSQVSSITTPSVPAPESSKPSPMTAETSSDDQAPHADDASIPTLLLDFI